MNRRAATRQQLIKLRQGNGRRFCAADFCFSFSDQSSNGEGNAVIIEGFGVGAAQLLFAGQA